MLGICFSGTGNSRHIAELFCGKYDKEAKVFSIENDNVIENVKQADEIVVAYPVHYQLPEHSGSTEN